MPFVAHYSRRKLLLAIVAALAFVAVSILVLMRRHPSLLDIGGGTAALVFFGLCAAILTARLFDRSVILVIDQNGIFDRRVKDRQLPWSAIGHVAPVRLGRQRFYLVQPSVPLGAYIDRTHKKVLAALNRPWTRSGFFVGASGLDTSFETIGEAVHRFRNSSGEETA